jgi:hypothetical protein
MISRGIEAGRPRRVAARFHESPLRHLPLAPKHVPTVANHSCETSFVWEDWLELSGRRMNAF